MPLTNSTCFQSGPFETRSTNRISRREMSIWNERDFAIVSDRHVAAVPSLDLSCLLPGVRRSSAVKGIAIPAAAKPID